MQYRVKKTRKQLEDIYKEHELERELKYTADTIKHGYFRMNEVDYIRWLCYAALDRIKEKE